MDIEKERDVFESTRVGEFKNVIFVVNEYWTEGHYVGKSNHYEDTDDAYYLSQSWFSWVDRAKFEAKKLEGCVVVPLEPTQKMLDAFPEVEYEDTYCGTCSLWVDDLTLTKGYKAMVEAVRGGMNFEEWVNTNKTASGIQELANNECVSACREAWNYQQEKIDAAMKILNDIYSYEYDMDTGIKINKIKEILK